MFDGSVNPKNQMHMFENLPVAWLYADGRRHDGQVKEATILARLLSINTP
jgi:hypothetical protein